MTVMRPSKPPSRKASTARNPASDAPTTATCSSTSPFDRDGLLRAAPHRLLDLAPQLLGRLLLQGVEEVVVPHLAHLVRDLHAQGVVLAQIEVDDAVHPFLLIGSSWQRSPPLP